MTVVPAASQQAMLAVLLLGLVAAAAPAAAARSLHGSGQANQTIDMDSFDRLSATQQQQLLDAPTNSTAKASDSTPTWFDHLPQWSKIVIGLVVLCALVFVSYWLCRCCWCWDCSDTLQPCANGCHMVVQGKIVLITAKQGSSLCDDCYKADQERKGMEQRQEAEKRRRAEEEYTRTQWGYYEQERRRRAAENRV